MQIIGIEGIGEIKRGDDLPRVIARAIETQGLTLMDGDILVVTHKIVSKAEGRVIRLDDVEPSKAARRLSRIAKKDPRLVEVILLESKRIVRMVRGLILVETRRGFVCANAGVDQSNAPLGYVCLPPRDSDRSARLMREAIKGITGRDVAVIISDTYGRPWREGQIDVAIGISGLKPLKDYRGQYDKYGYELKVTNIAMADELASAAELVMGKTKQVPVALVRGCDYERGEGSARELIRRPSRDIFR